jgi:hypothetical protein
LSLNCFSFMRSSFFFFFPLPNTFISHMLIICVIESHRHEFSFPSCHSISSWATFILIFSSSISLIMLMHMTSKLPFQLSPLSTKQVTHRNTMLEKILLPYRKGHAKYCSISEWLLLKFNRMFLTHPEK